MSRSKRARRNASEPTEEPPAPPQELGDDDDEGTDWRFIPQADVEECVNEEYNVAPSKSKITDNEYSALVAKMARYIVMKGCSGDPISVSKLNTEVIGEKYKAMRIGKNVMIEAGEKVKNIFGFKLVKAPAEMFPQTKFKDCFYLVNTLRDRQFRNELMSDSDVALRGILMVILAFIYSSNFGTKSHQLSLVQLETHLDQCNPNLSKSKREKKFGYESWEGIVDHFCKQHFIIKEKEEEEPGTQVWVLSLGPRAYIDVGRLQILNFTHGLVGQTVNQTLLAEIAGKKNGGAEDN